MSAPSIPPQALNATAISRNGGKLKKAWRGCGQSMLAFAAGHLSSGVIGQVVRSRHIFPIPIRRFIAVYALFSVYQKTSPTRHQDCVWGSPDDTGTGAAGAAFRQSMKIQLGFEYPYVNSVTGLATRPAVPFSGASFYQYVYPKADGIYHVFSDIYDIGQTIPAGTPFGLHSGTQSDAASGTNGTLPFNFTGENRFENRYEGFYTSSTPIIGSGTDDALNRSSYTAFAATNFGDQRGITPSFLLVETEEDVWEQVTIAASGDSTLRKTGEGRDGLFRGDARGSADGNGGWAERYVVERLGYPMVNFGQAGDGFKYVGANVEWARHRIALMKAANPTHILSANNINDLTVVTTPASWAGSTAYVRGDVRANNTTSIFICEKSGTSAASGGPKIKSLRVRDGTCTWRYVGENAHEEKIMAFAQSYFMRLRDAMPNVPIIQSTPGPNTSASTDFYTSTAGQTVSGGFGDNTSVKGKLASLIRTGKFGSDAYIELGLSGVENTFSLNGDVATEDSKFPVVAGAAFTFTGALSAATSGTLSANWAGETGTGWVIAFSDGSFRKVTLTNGSAAVTWTGAVTATANVTITQGNLITDDGTHWCSNGCEVIARGIRGNAFNGKRAA